MWYTYRMRDSGFIVPDGTHGLGSYSSGSLTHPVSHVRLTDITRSADDRDTPYPTGSLDTTKAEALIALKLGKSGRCGLQTTER
jgi:hypothetical protein